MPPGTTLREVTVDSDEFLATDSRLRLATNSQVGLFSRPGLVDPPRIVCTEPSPDVAVTVANSLAAGVSVLGKGSGTLSATQVEGLVALGERTAAIQLLRDKMYQTCLAYSNGAISGTTYSLAMADLDDTIVTMLLGETAGGAFGRQGPALGGTGNADASASVSQLGNLSQTFDEQTKELAERQKAIDDAKAELAKAQKVEDVATTPENEREVAVAKANAALEAAEREHAAALSLMQSTATAMTDVAATITATGFTPITNTRDPATAAVLAGMQTEFLLDDFNDNFISACLAELAVNQVESAPANVEFRRLMAVIDNLENEIHDLYNLLEKNGDKEKSRLTSEQIQTAITQAYDRKEKAENDLQMFLASSNESIEATDQTEFLDRLWKAWVTPGADQDAALANYVSGLNMNRRSALTDICLRELPDALKYGRIDLKNYRVEKLKTEGEVTLLRERRLYLETCDKLPADDKAKCRKLLLD